MKIAEAASDERGALAYGKKGDQTGNEVRIRTMTGTETGSAGFEKILRFPDNATRAEIAKNAVDIALNDHIGYGQYGDPNDPLAGRYGLWEASQGLASFRQVKTDCNTDCSQLVSTDLNHVGLPCSKYMRTATEIQELTALGFVEYPYTAGACVLGDIVWRQGHTAVVIEAPEGEGGEEMFSARLTSSKDTRTYSTGAGPKTRACPYIKIKKADIGFTPNVIIAQMTGEILANTQWIRGQAHAYTANYENDATAGIACGTAPSYFNPDAEVIYLPVRFPEKVYIVRAYK